MCPQSFLYLVIYIHSIPLLSKDSVYPQPKSLQGKSKKHRYAPVPLSQRGTLMTRTKAQP